MKRITFFVLLSVGICINSFPQPDTNIYEKGRVWIGLKQPLKTVDKMGFKNALKASDKDSCIQNLKSIKHVFKSKDKKLEKIYELCFEYEKDLLKYLKNYEEYMEYVEYVPKVFLDSPYTPNDYDGTYLWHIDHLGLRDAWGLMQGITTQTKVALIDDGFDGDHEDLIGNIAYIEPGADNNEHHGTATSGLAGMTTNNGIGYCSVAGLFCDLYLFRGVYDGSGPTDIESAADMGVRVISMSFRYSCTAPSSTYTDAIEYAYSKGVFMVASGGNCSCTTCSTYQYPACHDHVFAVASLEEDDSRNTVCTTSYYDKIDISAPGINLTSTTNDNTYYHTACCTSAAAPIVGGVAALLFAINPSFTPDDIERILKATAYDLYQIPENQPYIGMLGAGRVDAYCAVYQALTPLNITGNISGNYSRYYVNISNATVTGNITINAGNININGPFEIGTGKTLTTSITEPFQCQ